jgi:hypothetical protein
MVTGVTCCGYCGQQATSTIVSNPVHVCLEHAIEFWTGLLVYARDNRHCCLKLEQLCACPSCEDERLATSHLRALAAIYAAAPPSNQEVMPPSDHEHSPIRLAWRTDFSAACLSVGRDSEAGAWLRDDVAADGTPAGEFGDVLRVEWDAVIAHESDDHRTLQCVPDAGTPHAGARALVRRSRKIINGAT